MTIPLYRCPTGYRHRTGTTALDVLTFESDELGNADILAQALKMMPRSTLRAVPAHRVTWFTATRRAARRYGHAIEAVVPPPGARILALDGDGGMLVLFPEATT